ncbi:MAG: HAMP domain-containing histidine kinase [Candidatus Delongbacteria bacterium]|nr:HAMP domain-containing histidine kinase [Candidatus Delongbacteria bacterium]MBN2833952.1 HAMP domain-containing histidine kinase [Candidatus Delongbacteria bacterium]
MKFSRITLKIFLSFLFLILFTFMIFSTLMFYFRGKEFERIHSYYSEVSVTAFKELLESRFSPYSLEEIEGNHYYQEMMDQIKDKFHLETVITGYNDKILIQSYGLTVPEFVKIIIEKSNEPGNKLKNPFPIIVPYKTKNGSDIKIYLFSDIEKKDRGSLFEIFLILLFLFNIITLFYVSRKLTRPIRKFETAIKSFSDGDFSARVENKSHDEFDDLAKAFNIMAHRISQTIAEQKETSANISHELRSPLTRIKVALQILKDLIESGNTNNLETYFEMIDKDIDGMDGLIDGILKLYRMESDFTNTKTIINIGAIIKEEIGKQKNLFELNRIKIKDNLDKFEISIKTSKSIQTAISNIITNAAKYTDFEGSFEVNAIEDENSYKINFSNSKSPDHYIDLKKITIPFYRGDNCKNIKGHGMGLSITNKIIKLCDFKLEFNIYSNKFQLIIVIDKS